MAEETKLSKQVASNFADLATPDNIQKYIFGTKDNGDYRALWDIVKDCIKPEKKKKKKKHKKNKKKYDDVGQYSVYLEAKNKKKKKKHKKHWHI